ncbi:hypothetical protein CcCBS67573_g09327 [Chytriomyces confervae]|uniref:CUE domain-containing protein n=1 Tax=Chytriomyces confervae TaxID=246404 RepID=A0A507DZU3_9FUNG|nr:hypothetical protein CcCBS67573_g09327 [Chytriomyces confervae]
MAKASTDPVTVVVSLLLLFFILRYLLASPQQSQTNNRQQNGAAATANTGRTGRRQVVPPERVDAVLQMFPNYPRNVIESDLARTGSVERTLDNILSGALPAPPPPPPQANSSSSVSEAPVAFSASPYLAAAISQKSNVEPEKVWEQTPAGREANLRLRKEHMVRQARERAAAALAAKQSATTSSE